MRELQFEARLETRMVCAVDVLYQYHCLERKHAASAEPRNESEATGLFIEYVAFPQFSPLRC